MKVLYKHHELNYFGPSYWRGIACAWNYSMHMQIHLLRYIKKSFDSIIYIYYWKGIALPKQNLKGMQYPHERSINTMD